MFRAHTKGGTIMARTIRRGTWAVGLALAATFVASSAAPAPAPVLSRQSAAYQAASTLTTVAPAAAGSKSYSLPDPPAGVAAWRWDPCDGPIGWTANLSGAPAGALRNVRYALRQITSATGLTFAYRGTTTKVPQKAWTSSSYPSDLVIAWASPGKGKGRSDLLPGGSVAAQGGWVGYSSRRENPDGTVSAYALVTNGFVVVDRVGTSDMPTAVDARGGLTLLLMHELGHAMTLQHVNDERQGMYPTMLSGRLPSWAAGDLAGFRIVGTRAGCVAT